MILIIHKKKHCILYIFKYNIKYKRKYKIYIFLPHIVIETIEYLYKCCKYKVRILINDFLNKKNCLPIICNNNKILGTRSNNFFL
jgi:hypothetical protein